MIRIILIQRAWNNIDDIKIFINNSKEYSFIKENIYSNNFLKLPILNENDLITIQKNYAGCKIISDNEYNRLYNYLKRIDEKTRALYAIIIIDAYLNDPDTVFDWDKKEDALNYIYDKETLLIKDNIINYCGKENSYLYQVSLAILAMATMVGGIKLEKELMQLLPSEYKIINKNPYLKKRYFKTTIFSKNENELFQRTNSIKIQIPQR